MNALTRMSGAMAEITTSPLSGTTMGLIRLPMSRLSSLLFQNANKTVDTANLKERYIIDTPGLYNQSQLQLLLGMQELKFVIPKKRLVCNSISLETGTTTFIAGLIRIDCISSNQGASLVFFGSNQLKTYTCDTASATAIYSQRLGKKKYFIPPIIEHNPSFPPLELACIISGQRQAKICYFSGIGWITIKGDATVNIYSPGGKGVELLPDMKVNS